MNRDKQPNWLEDFNKKFCSYPKFVPKEALFHPEHKKASKKWHLMNEDEVKAFIATELERERENVKKVIEQIIENDYHNIGMGSLDYNEKCAVDAFIESFLSRLQALQDEGKGEK